MAETMAQFKPKKFYYKTEAPPPGKTRIHISCPNVSCKSGLAGLHTVDIIEDRQCTENGMGENLMTCPRCKCQFVVHVKLKTAFEIRIGDVFLNQEDIVQRELITFEWGDV